MPPDCGTSPPDFPSSATRSSGSRVSKAITSLVALTLLEEGRFALDEPITRWAPELARMRVLRAAGGALDDTVAAERAITFDDLLTHRAGLTYADFAEGPLARAYPDALGGDIDSEVTPDEWIARLAELPLVDQPGSQFHYSRATDLLGLLLARMEDAPLGEVMRRRLFEPLGMTSTCFRVPPSARGRRARMYGFDDAGRLIERPTGSGGAFLAERPDAMTVESGGQGLWSTVDDLLAFARLFVGHGFGLGVAVVLDPARATPTLCSGAAGTVGWPGAFGAWWQADPVERSVMIFLAHNALEVAQMARGVELGVYGAISEFHAMGSG